MKILNASQIRELDAFTIKNEPIKSIDLMERASLAFVSWFAEKFAAEENEIVIFVGPGNNGGDGLAVARLLYFQFFKVEIYWCKIGNNTSKDFDINLVRLPKRNAIHITEVNKGSAFPKIPAQSIIIDASRGRHPNDNYAGAGSEYL